METLDLIALVLYLGVVVGFGCWFVRKSGSTGEFMAAGGSLPAWAVGLSIFGTYVSSISFLANPGKSFADNWNPFVFGISLPLAAWIATKWFVPFYRRIGEVSAYHHLEARFGAWARTYAVICYLLTQIARVGTIMYLVALALAPLTGLSIWSIILITGVLVTIYTLLGGIEAVIWTDAIQSIVLTIGIFISLGVIFTGMPEGPGQIFEMAAAENKFSMGSMGASLTQSTFWVVLIYGLMINLQNFGIDQSYVQRYITADSESSAKKSVWMGALLYLPISALLFLVGTGLFAFYGAGAGTPLEPGMKADAVFPHFIVNELPAGMTGILVAAIFAAAMSSVDSSLNSSATLTLKDLYQRYFRPDAGEKESMKVLYAATLFWGIAGTGMAIAMMSVKTALDAWWSLAGIFSGGMLGLFLLGMISQARNPVAITSTAMGVVVILWMSLSSKGWWPESIPANVLHTNMTIVCGTLTILLVGLLLSGFGFRKGARGSDS